MIMRVKYISITPLKSVTLLKWFSIITDKRGRFLGAWRTYEKTE